MSTTKSYSGLPKSSPNIVQDMQKGPFCPGVTFFLLGVTFFLPGVTFFVGFHIHFVSGTYAFQPTATPIKAQNCSKAGPAPAKESEHI